MFQLEKDYYLTLCLNVLQKCGFQMEFKGGASLAKGFSLIERSSEDVDLSIFNVKKNSIASKKLRKLKFKEMETSEKERLSYFTTITNIVKSNIPGTNVRLGADGDLFFCDDYSNGVIWVDYKSVCKNEYDQKKDVNCCFASIVLEISHKPHHLPIDLTNNVKNSLILSRSFNSILEEYCEPNDDIQWPFVKNINCIHPFITVLQKLMDCLFHRFDRKIHKIDGIILGTGRKKIAYFDSRNVRHFEDCAEVISNYYKIQKDMNSYFFGNELKKLGQDWPYAIVGDIFYSPKYLFELLEVNGCFRRSLEGKKLYSFNGLVFISQSTKINAAHSTKWQRYIKCYESRKKLHWGENRYSLLECCNIITTWLELHDI